MRRLLSVTAAFAVLAAAPLAGQTPTPVEADPVLEDAAIRWMNFLVDGHFDSAGAQVSPQVADRMGAEALEQLWPQVTAQVGDLQDLQPEGQSELNGLRIVTMAGTFGGGVFDVQVVYDAEQRVVGFSVRPPGAGGR